MRSREYQLHFFLSEEEMLRLEEMCARSKRSKSQVVRDLIRTGRVLEAPGPELHEFAVQMRAIGVSLNQIAARANSVGIIDADYYEMQAEQWARLWGQLYTRFMTGGNTNGSNENVAGPQSDEPHSICDAGAEGQSV